MPTAQKFDSIKIGVCDCFWRPVPTLAIPNPDEIYLGLTKGGCELTYTPEWKPIEVDQFGKTPTESVLIGEDVNVKVPLAETDLGKLELFSHTASKTTVEESIGTVQISGGATGVPNVLTSADTTPGTAGVQQVETATVTGGATADGDVKIIVTADGLPGSPLTIAAQVFDTNTANNVASNLIGALQSNGAIIAMFTVSGSNEDVVLTKINAEANDATLNMEINGSDNATGVPDVASSVDTTAGVAPVLQVETTTVTGGATTDSGDLTVTVTAAGMTGTPRAILVAVDQGDTADEVANKIRTALSLDANVTAFFTVSGATDEVILTAIADAANDATMNIAIDGGTSAELSIGATSFTASTVVGLWVGDTLKLDDEEVVIASISGNDLTLKNALTATHADGISIYKIKTKLLFGRRPGLRLEDLAGRLRLHPIASGESLDEDVIIYRAINRAPLQLNYRLDEERVFQTEFQGIVARQSAEAELSGQDAGDFLWQIGNPSI